MHVIIIIDVSIPMVLVSVQGSGLCVCKVFFQILQEINGWIYARTAAIGKTRGKYLSSIVIDVLHYFLKLYLCMRLHATEPVLSRWKLTARWSNAAQVTIDLRSQLRTNQRPTRFVSGKANEFRWPPRRYQMDPWSRRGEVALHSSPKPDFCFVSPSERDRELLPSFF